MTLSSRQHLPRLDGVRGIAILLVLLSHFRLYGRTWGVGMLDELVLRTWEAGWVGVDLFFVLSGFLITGILIDSRGGEDYFRSFYMRRVLRIFPLYYGSLILLTLVLPAIFPDEVALADMAEKGPWFWLYLTNVMVAGMENWPEMAGHFWSLAVEEQFYLVWPLLVALVAPKRLRDLCLVLIATAVLYRVWLTCRGLYLSAYVLTPARMDTLLAGALLAIGVRDPRVSDLLQRFATRGLLIGCGLMALLFVIGEELPSEGAFAALYVYSATPIWGAAVVNYAVSGPADSTVGRWLEMGWLRSLGVYSYGLYVLHQPILEFVPLAWTTRYWPPGSFTNLHWLLLFSAGAMAASLAAAVLSWHLLERPFLRLKKRFPYGAAASSST